MTAQRPAIPGLKTELCPVRPEGLSGKELGDATGIKDSSLTKARDQLVKSGVVGTVPRHKQGGGFYYKLAENTEPGGAK
ncbi:hypothetical protein FAM19031_001845 [Propionibacterium freudenreichii]|uniref:hypothetical protein n=1 Tax=Propionibacterium freudenreichii TaxID=1744 RepID=UPI00254E6D38|nr:hypothetical protein [Propionibacterium freudenreichii]MDK9295678.1 hypothetical protein [Propionibacterium freudenreichii]MDK9361069.1 hypothetical protein [Propionibacterium freudenreichii]